MVRQTDLVTVSMMLGAMPRMRGGLSKADNPAAWEVAICNALALVESSLDGLSQPHRAAWGTNVKNVYRIYIESKGPSRSGVSPQDGMQLRNKTPKRWVKAKLCDDRTEAVGPNDVWAMDFVHDQLATGRKLQVLTVVDTFSQLTCRFWMRSSATGAKMLWRPWTGSVGKRAIPRPSALIRAVSSCRATWTSGPVSAALPSTSPGPANPRIMRSSCLGAFDPASSSTAASAQSA